MNSLKAERRISIIVGILFIIATVLSLVGSNFYDPIISKVDWLTQILGNANRIRIGALLEFVAALSSVGIAVWLYPVLRKYNHGMALAAVVFRLVEAIFYSVSAVGLLSLLGIAKNFHAAGSGSFDYYQAIGNSILETRDVIGFVFAVMAFVFGALAYYVIFYQTMLVPRWLSVWGIIGCLSLFGVVLFTLFTGPPFSMTGTVIIFALPIAIQEMILAVWLILKGFASVRIEKEDS